MNLNNRILDWHFNTKFRVEDCMSALGWIPEFVSEDDPRFAYEQFDANYIGGWNPMLPGKFVLDENNYLHYPGDPPMEPFAYAYCRDELILIYPSAWVCIVQRDGSFSVARMD